MQELNTSTRQKQDDKNQILFLKYAESLLIASLLTLFHYQACNWVIFIKNVHLVYMYNYMWHVTYMQTWIPTFVFVYYNNTTIKLWKKECYCQGGNNKNEAVSHFVCLLFCCCHGHNTPFTSVISMLQTKDLFC